MSYAEFQSDGTMERLVRGEPWDFVFSVQPAFDFSASAVEVHFDSTAGVRTTITEFVGTGSGTFDDDGITHAADQTAVYAHLTGGTTAGFDDGDVYKVTLVVDGYEWAVYDLPVVTPPGGPLV